MEEKSFGGLKILAQNSDIGIALGLFIILGILIVPIPPILMDLALALIFSISLIILLISVYTKRPLEFSTFPSVLLVVTLLRLAVNVASTRNILLRSGTEGGSAAGEIIEAFGEFVVGGNFAVGIIIFTILVIINFIVITKGAGRVAEVAARFTLDAMPGKQMAIDADLNSGLIDDKEAKRRREEVAREADFYGSMDGASKFVRGDAIAGIMITVVNVIGGVIVGMAQNGMSFSEAGELYVLLTVGDGLVAQIPGLIISTAAGIIITRNSSEISLGTQIGDQFKLHPKTLQITAIILSAFALLTDLPVLPFMILSVTLYMMSLKVHRDNESKKVKEQKQQLETKKATPENLETLLNLELVELEVGYGLVSLVDVEQKGDLLERITHIRKQFALDWGVIVPSVKVKDNLELKPGGYSIKIKGVEVAKGELLPDHFMAMDPGTVIDKIEGIEAKEPVFGLSALWVTDDEREEAQYNGYTVVDNSTIVATHLTEILKTNLHELFGRQELVRILDNFKELAPKLVTDLIPDILQLGTVLKVTQNLLSEGVSIRDLRTILESLAEHGTHTKDVGTLTELTRQALYRTITDRIRSDKGDVPIFTLDRGIEEAIAGNLVQTDTGQQVSLDPQVTQNILSSLNDKIEEATGVGEKMVVLCSPAIRQYFKRLTQKFIPNLVVISHNELAPDAKIRSLGTVKI